MTDSFPQSIMSFGPIPGRPAHGRENPVCAPLNRRPVRSRSTGAAMKEASNGGKKNPPVPRTRRVQHNYGLNRVVEPAVEGGAGELIFGGQRDQRQSWVAQNFGGGYAGQQHHRVSCLDREFKDKGGSLVVATGCTGAGGAGDAVARPGSSDHGRVNALYREKEAYGRRIPISNDLKPMEDPAEQVYGEENSGHFYRKHTLRREQVGENDPKKKAEDLANANHFRCNALRREQKENHAPWASEDRTSDKPTGDHRRRNMMKAEYEP